MFNGRRRRRTRRRFNVNVVEVKTADPIRALATSQVDTPGLTLSACEVVPYMSTLEPTAMRSFCPLLIALLPVPAWRRPRTRRRTPPQGRGRSRSSSSTARSRSLYEKDIEPILVNKCIVCHCGNVKEGKLDLGTYEALMKGGKRGTAVVPGKSAESLLVQAAGKADRSRSCRRAGEEPLTPRGAGAHQALDRPGRQGADGHARARPKVVAQRAAGRRHAGARRRRQPRQVAGRRRPRQPDPRLRRRLGRPRPHAGRPGPQDGPTRSRSRRRTCRWSSRWPTAPTASTSPRAATRKSSCGTPRPASCARRSPASPSASSPWPSRHDGKLLATGGGAPTEDGEVKIFDVGRPASWSSNIKNVHCDTVFGVCFSPDGKMLATCGADKFVKVFEVPSGKFLKSFEGHTHHVLDVGWKADGKLLASGRGGQRRQGLGLREGRAGRARSTPHTKQVTRAGVHRQDGQVRHLLAATRRCASGTPTAATPATSPAATTSCTPSASAPTARCRGRRRGRHRAAVQRQQRRADQGADAAGRGGGDGRRRTRRARRTRSELLWASL